MTNERKMRLTDRTEPCLGAPKCVRHSGPTLKGVANKMCLCKAKDPDELCSVRGRFCINASANSAPRPYAFLSYLQNLEGVWLYTDICNMCSSILGGQVSTAHLMNQIAHCREARRLCPLITRLVEGQKNVEILSTVNNVTVFVPAFDVMITSLLNSLTWVAEPQGVLELN